MPKMLVVEVAGLKCAFALSDVIETMRPLRLEPVVDAPDFVSGIALIRGMAVPVVEIGRLMNLPQGRPGRFVTLRAENRIVAAAVEGVVGIINVPKAAIETTPPLLANDASEALAIHDTSLLRILSSAKLLDEPTWHRLSEHMNAN